MSLWPAAVLANCSTTVSSCGGAATIGRTRSQHCRTNSTSCSRVTLPSRYSSIRSGWRHANHSASVMAHLLPPRRPGVVEIVSGRAKCTNTLEQFLDHLLVLVHSPHRPAGRGGELLGVVDPEGRAHSRHEVDAADQ